MIVAQLGARMHYAVPRILHQAGALERLYTDLCATKGWPRLLHAVPRPLRPAGFSRLLGRAPEGIPPAKVTAFTGFGLEYALKLRRARSASRMSAAFLWAGTRFNELVVRSGLAGARAVYGFNTASEGLFQEAANLGIRRVLEQTIAPRRIEAEWLGRESPATADWRAGIQDTFVDAFAERERREWELADLIVCASEFVRDGVVASGGDARKCVVVPYGVDVARYAGMGAGPRRRGSREEVTVLFAGTIGLRKGVPYLLDAMERLRGLPIRCRMIGSLSMAPGWLAARCPPNVEVVGAVSRSAMAQEYANADIFCLPSLCEGSATVTYEALAAGLPVVTTPNSGSIVRDGIEGVIVPPHDAAALAAALEGLCDDRAARDRMADAARERSGYGSLAAYAQRLLEALGPV
jgi:glycosyltransferase involved in cell wall biosynthesis